MWDSDVFTYQAGELLNASYENVQIGNAVNFTQPERRNIHWYRFVMGVDSSNIQ